MFESTNTHHVCSFRRYFVPSVPRLFLDKNILGNLHDVIVMMISCIKRSIRIDYGVMLSLVIEMS